MNEEIIIDGDNAVLGRLSSFVAKKALQGNKIVIVNSEKVIILGTRTSILAKFQDLRAKGGSSLHGPFYPSSPERILKRTIRGMVPKRPRGMEIFKTIMCYNGVPEEYKDKKMIKSKRGKSGMSLKEISKLLKGKNE